MKVAILVVGELRNFQVPMSNWYWPESWDIDYFLVTWDSVSFPRRLDTNSKKSSLPAIQEADSILNFSETAILKSPTVRNNNIKMLFLWKKAAQIMAHLDHELFVLVRPDLICIAPFNWSDHTVNYFNSKNSLGFEFECDKDGNIFTSMDLILTINPSTLKYFEMLCEMVILEGGLDCIEFDIHLALGKVLKHLKSTYSIDITKHHLNIFQKFICRREGPTTKLSQRELDIERDYSEWFWAKMTFAKANVSTQVMLPPKW